MCDLAGVGFDHSLLASHVNMCATALESLDSSCGGRYDVVCGGGGCGMRGDGGGGGGGGWEGGGRGREEVGEGRRNWFPLGVPTWVQG